MFLQEARDRWFSYPPPYYSGGSWYYATPWLWYDGDPHAGYQYSQWGGLVNARMNIPSPVTVTMWGDWWPAQGTGTIYAQFRNDSTETLNGNVLFVITEDSIYAPAPNGDQWHNHVARDYLPTHIGEGVSIPAGDSLVLSRSFTLQPTWDASMIQFVTWIQDVNMNPEDSVIEIWQGGILNIDELGIEEFGNNQISANQITPVPNPCVNNTRFAFTLPSGEAYKISFFDVSGRKIQSIDGIASGDAEAVNWDLTNKQGARVSAGVYLYRFESTGISSTGKVIVR
jgi:hypothetical protein